MRYKLKLPNERRTSTTVTICTLSGIDIPHNTVVLQLQMRAIVDATVNVNATVNATVNVNGNVNR